MSPDIKDAAWDNLSYAEKNKELFERQKTMLEEFMEKGAISKPQYEILIYDLVEKMGDRNE